MTIVIDPEFSVYHLVERMTTKTLLNHRRTMSFISREIENAGILEGAQGRIFSGFQVMSKFLPQVERYTRLAQVSESIYVFGVRDIDPPTIPNITYVFLEAEDQLAKEWFLIAHGEDYHSALATEELTHLTDPDELRQFRGFWTFDREMVKILEEWLSSAVDATPLFPFEPQYKTRRHLEIITRSQTRFSQHLAKLHTSDYEHEELSRLARETLQAHLAKFDAT